MLKPSIQWSYNIEINLQYHYPFTIYYHFTVAIIMYCVKHFAIISFHFLCMCLCVMYTCVCWGGGCSSMVEQVEDKSQYWDIFLNHFLTSSVFLSARVFQWTLIFPIQWFWLAVSPHDPPFSTLWDSLQCHIQLLCGSWGPELRSSCLYSKHFSPEPSSPQTISFFLCGHLLCAQGQKRVAEVTLKLFFFFF